MGYDDCVAAGIPVFGVAASFGHEFEAVVGKDGNEFRGWDSFRHGVRARSCDGEFSHGDFSDFRDSGGFREVLKIEFDSLLEIGNGFYLGGTKTGHVVIEALGDVVGFFAVEGVVNVSHRLKNREKSKDDKVGKLKGGRDVHTP
jgi:hypothetical protein